MRSHWEDIPRDQMIAPLLQVHLWDSEVRLKFKHRARDVHI